MSEIPRKVQEQYRQLIAAVSNLSRAECERRFPELIAYINRHVSLVDLMRADGIELKPLSPDTPGVFIAIGACPCCKGDLLVKEPPC